MTIIVLVALRGESTVLSSHRVDLAMTKLAIAAQVVVAAIAVPPVDDYVAPFGIAALRPSRKPCALSLCTATLVR